MTRTLNGTTESYANDAADKLTSITVGGNVVRSFTYDNLGRRKTDTVTGVGTTNYTWDQESRLIGYGANASYSYNAFDTRVSKTVSGTSTSYKRAGANVTDPVLSEVTGSTTTAHTPGISEKRGSNPTEYLHSGIKNADARTSGQTVDATRQYDAFGNLTSSSGTWRGPFGYAGGFGYQEDAVRVDTLFSRAEAETRKEAERLGLKQEPRKFGRGQDFPIGFLDEGGRKKVPYASPVPVFAAPRLLNSATFADDLKLSDAIGAALSDLGKKGEGRSRSAMCRPRRRAS